MELVAVEYMIESEIAKGFSQPEIAKTYALALRSSYPTDWARVNKAICDHWSRAGLERVKRLAWRNIK